MANERSVIRKGGGTYKIGSPYQVAGQWYVPRPQPDYDRIGIASWYGSDFHGRKTANGEVYDMQSLTAAHPTLPLPSYAYVTNLANGRTVLVRINDRGPYVANRVIDLSQATARELAMEKGGTGRVRVRYAGQAPLDGDDSRERRFLASRTWKGGPSYADAAPVYAPAPQGRVYSDPGTPVGALPMPPAGDSSRGGAYAAGYAPSPPVSYGRQDWGYAPAYRDERAAYDYGRDGWSADRYRSGIAAR